MSREIKHRGKIVNIEDSVVDVMIESHVDCKGCSAKSLCGMSDGKEKIVSIFVEHPLIYHEGEEVDVMASLGMGMRAVTVAYIYPFFVLIGMLFLLIELGLGEMISGLSALGALALYYLVLYFNRGRIEKEIVFKIEKI